MHQPIEDDPPFDSLRVLPSALILKYYATLRSSGSHPVLSLKERTDLALKQYSAFTPVRLESARTTKPAA